jgi:hypothetical protein
MSAPNLDGSKHLMATVEELGDLDFATGNIELTSQETKETELNERLERFRKETPHAQYRLHPQKPGKLQKKVNAGWRAICIHGKQDVHCKPCGSKAFCKHGRVGRLCKECGGKGLCPHGKTKHFCRDCGGKSFCEHNKRKLKCVDCKTKQVRDEKTLVLVSQGKKTRDSSKEECLEILE